MLAKMVECIRCRWAMTINPDMICTSCAGPAEDSRGGVLRAFGGVHESALDNLKIARESLGRREGSRMKEAFAMTRGTTD